MVREGWTHAPMGRLLEKVTRPVSVELTKTYQQIGIRSHGKGLFDKEHVTGVDLGSKRVFWVEPDCLILNIVFAWEQAVGRTTLKDIGKIASHRFPMYQPRAESSDIDYLAYLFKTPYGKHLLTLASPGGAGRNKTLGQADFLKTIVRIPPIQEQRAIVRLLKTWERAIDAVEKLMDLSERQLCALRQHLLTPEQHSRLRPGWEVRPLGDMADVYDGTHTTPDYKDSGVPFYTVEHVTKNDFSITKFISRDVFERENERVRLEKGDVLMTRIGDIGTPRYIDWEVEASFYVSLALIKTRSPLNSHYLHHYIGTRQFQRELYQRTIHVAFPKKINLGEIGKCMIALPAPSEQERVASILSLAEQEIANLKRQRHLLIEEKLALMQQLLSGKCRVKTVDSAAPLAAIK